MTRIPYPKTDFSCVSHEREIHEKGIFANLFH